MSKESLIKNQILPISLTVITASVLILFLWLEILLLNHFTLVDISLKINFVDILVGLTIYLKTSIDFAIFIGRLMHDHPTWKDRVAIEIGTAFGNALGTMIILVVWVVFKEVFWLLALMVLVASLVLFRLAEEGLEHAIEEGRTYPKWYTGLVKALEFLLESINNFVAPVLKYVVPNPNIKEGNKKIFWSLIAFSFTIPFILGLDDFAGYVSLFSIINVFGFAIGVFLGHMILNICLYIKPDTTIKIVKNSVISFIGSLFFIGLGIWGLTEVFKLFFH